NRQGAWLSPENTLSQYPAKPLKHIDMMFFHQALNTCKKRLNYRFLSFLCLIKIKSYLSSLYSKISCFLQLTKFFSRFQQSFRRNASPMKACPSQLVIFNYCYG